ncbi:ABC transporter [Sphaerisporangium melleum]|uniref:ABC transporter n=1 Tax=Sphaerisporangium melleum TaxID=321316 RepID=A0A917VNF5_9ACTN|nr:ABC transporter permease [Sphaerisporangium melleum]GGL01725.1 ABC transporter [Sphaerisporangium melleum]GII72156.1 ABC transporter [Sphaerisporangium melleum]
MLGYIRLELARVLRDVTFLLFGIAMPVVMYLIFTSAGLAPGAEREAALFAMVSMAAYGGMGAAFNNGSGLAEDKAHGWLRQLRLTPLAPTAIVAGKTITGMVVVVPAIAAILAAGALVHHVTLGPGQWVAIIALLWAGTIPFTLLGLGNGYRLSGQAAGLVNFASSVALAVTGGLWLPAQLFPGWLQEISRWTPTFNYADLSWHVAFGQAPSARSALILLGWLAVFGAYALYGYRRAGRRA